MARTVSSPVDSDVVMSDTERRNKNSKKSEVVDASDAENEEKSGDDDAEEYEIEEILEAKRGMFDSGRIGYWVKWKGFDTEHNSWVDEQDAGNANELINAFWEKEKKKSAGRPRKSLSTTTSRVISLPDRHKSLGQSDDTGISAMKKKRKSKSDSADADDEPRSSKKTKASETTTKKRLSKGRMKASNGNFSARDAPVEDDDLEEVEVTIGNMDQFLSVPDWTHMIRSVDTVCKDNDKLQVYFTLTSGEHVRADATVCKERFPQKLLDFYEAHLRWRAAEEVLGD